MGTIKTVKSSMGYIAARDRTDTCTGCKHFEKTFESHKSPYAPPVKICGKGGFYTSQMAVCGQYEKKGEN